jgi:hypothetical protein
MYTIQGTSPAHDNTFDAEFDYIDDSPVEGEQAYWVRVVQTDFHRAWSSPIYIENKIRKNL